MGQLEDMQVFVRVVEAGGIGHAAEQLGIAKSAVSRRLTELEARLGVSLISRTTRTSRVTDTGKLYYTHSLSVIDEVAELNSITANPESSLGGTLRLSAPLSFGLSQLTPALDDFAKAHPGLTLDIEFSDHMADLIAGGFDLAFRIGDLSDSTLKARKISPIQSTICASPAYLEKYGTPTTPEDLKNHQVLRYALDNTNSWTLFDKKGKKYSVNTPAKIIANNGDFLCKMAISGHGIIVEPTFITWEAIAIGELIEILPEYKIPDIYAYAVYPQTRYLSRRARLLIDFLAERFGDNPYWDQK
jgi:DNA-binding transcriptional LysR family regulator